MRLPIYDYETDVHIPHTFASALPETAHHLANILNVDLWGDQDAEGLSETDIDEAIGAILDQTFDVFLSKIPVLDQLPKFITVVGYRRLALDKNEPALDPGMMAERIVEDLDQEYGGDDPTEVTEAMEEAAKAFADVVRREYHVWQCEPAHEVLVDVRSWVTRERPEWLRPMIEEEDLEAPAAG